MSLITCPECGQQISDKAEACIHCGYPLSNSVVNQNQMFDVIFVSLNQGANKFLVRSILEQIFGLTKGQAIHAVENSDSVIIRGIKQSNTEMLKTMFEEYKCTIGFVPTSDSYVNPKNSDIEKEYEKRNSPVRCPRCKSTSITAGRKGYSLLTGFIGANKVKNFCSQCGYSWMP